MMTRVLFILFGLFFISLNIEGVISSESGKKCSEIVRVESTELLSYLGNVTFIAPGSALGTWTLTLNTDIPFTFIGGWNVMVKSMPLKGQAVFQNRDPVNIHTGDEISFRFRIHYASQKHVPKVKNIEWQKWTVCGDRSSKSALKFLDLESSSSSLETDSNEHGSGYFGNEIQRRYTNEIRQ